MEKYQQRFKNLEIIDESAVGDFLRDVFPLFKNKEGDRIKNIAILAKNKVLTNIVQGLVTKVSFDIINIEGIKGKINLWLRDNIKNVKIRGNKALIHCNNDLSYIVEF